MVYVQRSCSTSLNPYAGLNLKDFFSQDFTQLSTCDVIQDIN